MPQDHEDGTQPVIIMRADMTLCVDVTAQTIGAIDINISAQSVGAITIDIEAQSVGVYLKPDWEVREGHQKTFRGFFPNQGISTSQQVQYTVPAGKTLYIVYFAIASHAADSANRNENQICRGSLRDVTADEIPVTIGGNGGAAITFPPPVEFPAEHIVNFIVFNGANHNCNIYVSAGGYEI